MLEVDLFRIATHDFDICENKLVLLCWSIRPAICRILVFCFDREFKKNYVTVERSELERIQDYSVIDKLSYSVGKTKALNLLATLITVN